MTTYTNFELWLILYALKVLNDLSFENLVPHFPFLSMPTRFSLHRFCAIFLLYATLDLGHMMGVKCLFIQAKNDRKILAGITARNQ